MIKETEQQMANREIANLDGQQVFVRIKWPRQDKPSREDWIPAGNGSGKIYTITSLNSEWEADEEMQLIDRAIGNGGSFHESFVRMGYGIRKNVLDVYVVSLTEVLRRSFNTQQIFAKAQNAEYLVRKGDIIYCYGIVKQIYSPEIWPAGITEQDKESVNFSFHTLQASGFTRSEIWELTGSL